MEITPLFSQMSNRLEQASQLLQTQITSDKVQSPEGMLDIQFKIFQYANLLNCFSSILKNFKDLVSSVISKI